MSCFAVSNFLLFFFIVRIIISWGGMLEAVGIHLLVSFLCKFQKRSVEINYFIQ